MKCGSYKIKKWKLWSIIEIKNVFIQDFLKNKYSQYLLTTCPNIPLIPWPVLALVSEHLPLIPEPSCLASIYSTSLGSLRSHLFPKIWMIGISRKGSKNFWI
jgi:hypothetical protein